MLRAAGGDPLKSRRNRSEVKKLIAAALIVCTTIAVVAVTIRHVNNKQDAAWCHDHGYANYATKDGFCVGAGGKLFKIGEAPSPSLVRGRPQTANSRVPVPETRLD